MDGPDVFGSIPSGGHNLIGIREGGWTVAASDLTGSAAFPLDAKVGIALGDNGGPTKTLALLAGSPAIDAGDAGACALLSPPAAGPNGAGNVDQRGTSRPQPAGEQCDIGAFEFGMAGLQFFPLPVPVRLLDTRPDHDALVHPGTALSANQPIALPGHFTIGGVSVPLAAQALVGNATVDNTAGVPPGFATLYPSGTELPLASNLNFVPGTVRPNTFTVGLGGDGAFNLMSNTGGHFIIDITGYYALPSTGGLYFHPLAQPVRLLDTRAGLSRGGASQCCLDGGADPEPPRPLHRQRTHRARHRDGPCWKCNGRQHGQCAGWLRNVVPRRHLAAADEQPQLRGRHRLLRNAFTVGLGTDGSFNLFSNSGGDFVIDITGYYDTVAAGGAVLLPARATGARLDTRAGLSAAIHPGAPLAAAGR